MPPPPSRTRPLRRTRHHHREWVYLHGSYRSMAPGGAFIITPILGRWLLEVVAIHRGDLETISERPYLTLDTAKRVAARRKLPLKLPRAALALAPRVSWR